MKNLIVIAVACASLGVSVWLVTSTASAHGLYATTSSVVGAA